jgi:predicted MFS family arabinose efflux permease
MSGVATTQQFINDTVARRNTFLLAAAQALYGMHAVALITTSGLIGHSLADDKGLATLPISTFVTGTACLTVPASMYMRWVGRRIGFITGAGFGLCGALLAIYALYQQDFWIFCVATFLTGGYQAFAQYYRFAATDIASDDFKAKAISWVLVGGLFAALIGPMNVIFSKEIFAPVLFAGCFAVVAVLSLVSMAVLSFINIPIERRNQSESDARPLMTILKQPRLLVAIFCGMASYGMMNLIMTASPLAMVACGFDVDDAAWVIQWHVLAMYLPSFFTGHLINRFGKERIIAVGMVLLAICGIIALSGISFVNFGAALIFLGLGWNFGFVGATALVTDCYRPSERNKVQGVNDLCVFAMVAGASFTSGQLLHSFGWDAVNMMLFPALTITLLSIGGLALSRR